MKYLFRVTPGKTPFHVGYWAKNKEGFTGKVKDDIYVSPALYSWIKHYFDHENENVFAIERPKNMNPMTMACGINSVYHYVYNNKDQETINFVENCILSKKFKHPVILELTKELEERVKKKFGKSLKQMKGGTYLGTLLDWDRHPVRNGYPEIIMKVNELKGCKWEQLEYIQNGTFKGMKTGTEFKLEFNI